MDNYKERAIGILFLLGSILVLMATWVSPREPVAASEMNSRGDCYFRRGCP